MYRALEAGGAKNSFFNKNDSFSSSRQFINNFHIWLWAAGAVPDLHDLFIARVKRLNVPCR